MKKHPATAVEPYSRGALLLRFYGDLGQPLSFAHLLYTDALALAKEIHFVVRALRAQNQAAKRMRHHPVRRAALRAARKVR